MKNLIAVTGGIGSGKSSLMKNLAKLGFETHDLDKIVKEIYDTTVGKAFVQDEMPKALTRVGVDFVLLRDVLFNQNHKDFDPTRINRFEEFFSKKAVDLLKTRVNPYTKPVFVECSMLFEMIQKSFIHKAVFDYIVNVACSENIRLERACFRDRSDPSTIKAMMAKQWTEGDRLQEADLTIKNEGDADDLWVSTFKVLRYHECLSLNRYVMERQTWIK